MRGNRRGTAAAMLILCLLAGGCRGAETVRGGTPLTTERIGEVSATVFLSTVTLPYDPDDPPTLGEGEIGWTETGQVYHTHGDCRYLKRSRTLITGPAEMAGAQAPGRLCSACAKRDAEGKESTEHDAQTEEPGGGRPREDADREEGSQEDPEAGT